MTLFTVNCSTIELPGNVNNFRRTKHLLLYKAFFVLATFFNIIRISLEHDY